MAQRPINNHHQQQHPGTLIDVRSVAEVNGNVVVAPVDDGGHLPCGAQAVDNNGHAAVMHAVIRWVDAAPAARLHRLIVTDATAETYNVDSDVF